MIVGFHHLLGSQVEFVYPPLDHDKDECLSAEFLKKIAHYGLPDGSHLCEEGRVQFILNDNRSTYHCVSSFGQIEAHLLPKEDGISRTYV